MSVCIILRSINARWKEKSPEKQKRSEQAHKLKWWCAMSEKHFCRNRCTQSGCEQQHDSVVGLKVYTFAQWKRSVFKMCFIALPLNVNYGPILIFSLQILLHHLRVFLHLPLSLSLSSTRARCATSARCSECAARCWFCEIMYSTWSTACCAYDLEVRHIITESVKPENCPYCRLLLLLNMWSIRLLHGSCELRIRNRRKGQKKTDFFPINNKNFENSKLEFVPWTRKKSQLFS